jgi:ankyrin repeat protein
MERLQIQTLKWLLPCVALASNVDSGSADSALLAAVSCKNPAREAVEVALMRGANVDACDGNDMTPLMHIVSAGDMDIARSLIEKDANLWLKNKGSKTVFDLRSL